MKKNGRKLVASLLAFSLVFTSVVPVYADEPEEVTPREFLATAFMAADSIIELEEELGGTLAICSEDVQGLDLSDDWYADAEAFAEQFLLDYSTTSRSRSANSSPSDLNYGKADTILYSQECAEWSMANNGGTDFNKEAQYMFISHYIDRNDYYWGTLNPDRLMDGPSLSDKGNVYARWITNSDRNAYDNYMSVTRVADGLQQVVNLADGVNSIIDSYTTLTAPTKVYSDLAHITNIAKGVVLVQAGESVADVGDDFLALVNNIALDVMDSDVQLSYLYEEYINDPGIMSMYTDEAKEELIGSAIGLCAQYILSGKITTSPLKDFVQFSVVLSVNNFTDFFDSVAWLALRYGSSGRIANRFMNYLGW